MHYRFPLLVAVCTTCIGFAPSDSSSLRSNLSFLPASLLKSVKVAQAPPLEAEQSAYDRFMATGYRATEAKDYQVAVENFQQALALRPDDVYAQRAIENVKTYAYDRFMATGYRATREKDYQVAVENFQQALALRPDDFYAQQATRNLQSYLSRQATITVNEPEPDLLWLSLGLGVFAVGLAGFLFIVWGLRRSQLNSAPQYFSKQDSSARKNVDAPLPTIPKSSQKAPNSSSKTEPTTYPFIDPQNSESSKATEHPNNANQTQHQRNAHLTGIDLVGELIKDLQTSDPRKRRSIIWELTQRGDSRAIKPLVEQMLDCDSREHSLILEALTQIGARTLQPMNQALTISLEDDSAEVRKNAVREFTQIYDSVSQISQLLAQAVDDSDTEVREVAQWALNQLTLNQILFESEIPSISN